MKRDLLLAHYEREVYYMKGKLKKSVKRNEIVFSNRSSLFESTKLRKKMGEEKKKKKRRGRKIGREKLDWRESNILLKSWNSKKNGGEEGRKNVFSNLAGVYTLHHFHDGITRGYRRGDAFPQRPPPSGKYVRCIGNSGPFQTPESSCLFSSFLLLVNLFH